MNVWRPYSDRGQPFGDHADPYPTALTENLLAPHFGSIFLRNPLVWVGVAVLATVWARWAGRRPRTARWPRPEPDRAVLVAACLALVLGMLAVFTYAPIRQYPGWSVALGNAEDIVRDSCGLQDDVTALLPTPARLGPPSAPARTDGDMVDAATSPAPNPVPDLGQVWHNSVPDSSGRGGLVTGWYPVPPGSTATDVVVPMLVSGGPDETVAVEFAQGPPRPRAPPSAGRSSRCPTRTRARGRTARSRWSTSPPARTWSAWS